MSKTRRKLVKSAELACGLAKPPPPPTRIITHVSVPFFSNPDEWPAHIEANRKMLAKSGYGILVDNPKCERTPFANEDARFEQFMMAYQRWLTTDGAELGAEPVPVAFERLREQFRDWQPPTAAAA